MINIIQIKLQVDLKSIKHFMKKCIKMNQIKTKIEKGSFVLKFQIACMFSAVRLVKSFHSICHLT